MLKSLYIKNYVLIQQLDITFHSGFSVITGETGAGKSIILGAIGLLLGQRADSKMIFAGEKRCIIEAEFDIQEYNLTSLFEKFDIDTDNDTCIIRRELNDNGKSRAFVNDTPVPLPTLRAIGERLIDVHSQNNNMLLASEDFQIEVLDALSTNKNIQKDYAVAFSQFTAADRELKEAKEKLATAQADEDYLRFQLDQLDSLQLEEGKQELMEAEQQKLEHADEIESALWSTINLLQGDGSMRTGSLQELTSAEHQLKSIEKIHPATSELTDRLHSSVVELQDIASSLESLADDIEINPSRLESINEWLSELYSVMKKHHTDDENSLISIREDIRKTLDTIDNSEEHITALAKERDAKFTALLEIAHKLTASRQAVASSLEHQLGELLVPLGIPNARFKVEITPLQEPSTKGVDKISFLFSANKQSQLRPISEVASGGEIARVMLSLKSVLSERLQLPTIIFDEIDTGVSGHIADSMSKLMTAMGSKSRQVIAITHLPQIAAAGNHHYKVFKSEENNITTSNIKLLTSDERITEIAQMLSGKELTQAAIENAKELLTTSKAQDKR